MKENYLKAVEIFSSFYNNEDLSKEKKERLYKEYLSLIRLSADAGIPMAQFHLALHYEENNALGENLDFDLKKSFYWIEKACEGDVANACSKMIEMLEAGRGCRKNIKKANEIYKKYQFLRGTYKEDNLVELLEKMCSSDVQ